MFRASAQLNSKAVGVKSLSFKDNQLAKLSLSDS